MAETGTHIKGENRYKYCSAEEHSWGSGCGYPQIKKILLVFLGVKNLVEEEARLDAQSGGHAPHQLQLRGQVSLYALYTHDN